MEIFSVDCRFDTLYLNQLGPMVEAIIKDVIPQVEFKRSSITDFDLYNLEFPSVSILHAQNLLKNLKERLEELLSFYGIKVYKHSKILTV